MNQELSGLIKKGWIIILITLIIIYHVSDIGCMGSKNKTSTKYRRYHVNPPHLWQKNGRIKEGGGDLEWKATLPKNDQNMLYLSFSKNMTKYDYEREGGHTAPQASLSQIGLKKGDLKVVGGVRQNIISTV